jgi:hypothetical protein
MATGTQPQPSQHPKWEAFTSSFKQSNYITDFWNWFMTLMSKAAEMVLFGTVLYSGYQLLPGVPHVPATIDAAVFVIQQGALDIGGMGLLKLAKRAGLPRESFPVRLGATLVVLMILNVALASVKHTLPMIPDGVFVGIETLLLIARAIVAVLFGHAIHALREEYSESTITVKEASELQESMVALAMELARVQETFHGRLSSELATLRENFHRQLSSELSPLRESVHHSQELLASIPAMQARLQHIENSTVAETHKQPVLRALPSIRQDSHDASKTRLANETRQAALQATGAAGKFDARAFVFARLSENPDLKLAEIEQLARATGQELSQPTASRYRRQFFNRHESSSMKDESANESVTMKVQDSYESSATDERKVVGE